MPNVGLFSPLLRREAWFSPLLIPVAWFDEEFIPAAPAGIQKSGSDSGAGSDAMSVNGLLSAQESSVATEVSQLASTLTVSELNTLADESARIGLQGQDAGASVDNSLISASIGVGELPGVTESALLSGLLAGSDVGIGTDPSLLISVLAAADSGALVIEVGTVPLPIAGADSGVGTEAAVRVVSVIGAESGIGSEQASRSALISGSELGTSIEQSSLIVVAFGVETVVPVEQASLLAPLFGADTGTSSDLGVLQAAHALQEVGIGDDFTVPPVVVIIASELGISIEQAALLALIAATELSAGADIARIGQDFALIGNEPNFLIGATVLGGKLVSVRRPGLAVVTSARVKTGELTGAEV